MLKLIIQDPHISSNVWMAHPQLLHVSNLKSFGLGFGYKVSKVEVV